MNKTIILTAKECRHMGGIGWMLPNMPEEFFGIVEGRTLAHDVLEHDSIDIGSADNELRAIGTALYIREQQLIGRFGLVSNIGSDLVNVFRDSGASLAAMTNVKVRSRPEYRELFTEMEDYVIRNRDDFDHNETLSEGEIRIMVRRACQHLTIGYRNAAKRFKKYPLHCAESTFNAIRDAFRLPEYEGEQVELIYNIEKCTARIHEYYPEEY